MDEDLEALRRRAFSRDGTDDDLRMLAEAEPVPIAEAVPEPVPAPEAEPPIQELPRLRGSRRPILVAASIGLAVGVAATVAGLLVAERIPDRAAGEAALAIFDSPGAEPPLPPPPNVAELGVGTTEVRYLATVENTFVYATRAGGVVCLALVGEVAIASTCTPVEDFPNGGLGLGDGRLEVNWGRSAALEVRVP